MEYFPSASTKAGSFCKAPAKPVAAAELFATEGASNQIMTKLITAPTAQSVTAKLA
jgi:hypothetical protein